MEVIGMLTKTQHLALAVAIVVAIAALAHDTWWAMLPVEDSCARVRDDAYYYFEVARNIALGHGSTFDRLHDTNGFHPLWLLMLVPVYKVLPAIDTGYRCALLLQGILNAGAIVLLFLWLRRLYGSLPALIAVIAYQLPQMGYQTRTGMESALAAVLLFGVLHYWARVRAARDARSWWVIGGLLALLVLTRLDCFFLVMAIAVLALVSRITRASSRDRWPLLPLLLPSVMGLAAFVGWNYFRFGHATTVSAAIKSSYPVPSFSLQIVRHEQVAAVAACAAFAWLLHSLYTHLWSRNGHVPQTIILLCLAVLMHVGNLALFMTGDGLGNWHFVLYVPLLLAALAMVIHHLLQLVPETHRRTRVGHIALGAGIGLVAAITVFAICKENHHLLQPNRWFPRESYRAAQWCNVNLNPATRIGMTDCGAFGYFCRCIVINLDGVINSFDYYENYLRTGQVHQYLVREKVDLLAVHHVAMDEPPSSIGRQILTDDEYEMSSLRDYMSGLDGLLTSSSEVYHGQPYWDGPHQGLFVIWDIDALSKQLRP
jgi:hypothetical protein